ncbi:hypothetical protein M3557_16165, partial [Bhargavaea ginsengi]
MPTDAASDRSADSWSTRDEWPARLGCVRNRDGLEGDSSIAEQLPLPRDHAFEIVAQERQDR